MNKAKLLEIGSYPPPNSGWSVRIKYLKDAFNKAGHDCKVLNLGKYRRLKKPEYIDVQNGFDYLIKLIVLRLRRYHFHVHINAQAVKGPILSLIAVLISLFTFERPALTFHGGYRQLYFPRENGSKMYLIIYMSFILSKVIVCNDEAIKSEIRRYGLLINNGKIYPIQAFSVQYWDYKEIELPNRISGFIQTKKQVILNYTVLRNGFFIETLIKFLKRLKYDIGVIMTGIREVEDEEVSDYYQQLQDLESKGIVLLVNNLSHDQFMTLLSKSGVYLRTYISDGVASSVLEALSQNVPVVASENGRRPESVITYAASDVDDLESKVTYVLNNLESVKIKFIFFL